MYGSQVSSASVSRLRTEIASCSSVRRDGSMRMRSGSWNSSVSSSLCGSGEDVGNVEPVDRAGLHADRADQHEPAHELSAPWWRVRRRSSHRSNSRSRRPGRDRADPAVPGRCRRCRPPHRSSRAGWIAEARDATARSAGVRPTAMAHKDARRETLRAVKEQYRWPVAILEQLQARRRRSRPFALQGTSSWFCRNPSRERIAGHPSQANANPPLREGLHHRWLKATPRATSPGPPVLAGRVPAIHVLPVCLEPEAWMAGPTPAMTVATAWRNGPDPFDILSNYR